MDKRGELKPMKLPHSIKYKISYYAGLNDINGLKTYLLNLITENSKSFNKDVNRFGTNSFYLHKFYTWLTCDGLKPYFKIFVTDGNKKLPFVTFSTLPGVTCPGAGDCLKWCYSFKAWTYPGAFFRQVQNTLLMHDFDVIRQELKKLVNLPEFKKMNKIDFRLYVDGDFKNIQEIKLWMELLKEFPQVNAYGYSKSLNLFKALSDTGYKFPKNYVLNLSNGGKFDYLHEVLNNLNFVRGNFEALDITKKTKISEIRKTYPNKKIFVCPGQCGDCTKIGHACGDLSTFKGYSIVIPKH